MSPEGDLRPDSLVVHGGRPPVAPGGSLNPPVVLSSTFHQGGDLVYGRDANPTWEALEAGVAALEGGATVAFASGMGAIAAL
ncbi:MAG: PLP-dependent transferase, partial [Actinomycetota bacterium]|nr:PLP-dependent transferase [Actinomycetota bacterium]